MKVGDESLNGLAAMTRFEAISRVVWAESPSSRWCTEDRSYGGYFQYYNETTWYIIYRTTTRVNEKEMLDGHGSAEFDRPGTKPPSYRQLYKVLCDWPWDENNKIKGDMRKIDRLTEFGWTSHKMWVIPWRYMRVLCFSVSNCFRNAFRNFLHSCN